MRSIRTRLRLYVPSDIDEEVREETTKLIEEAADYIDVLEKLYAESRQELMKWIRNDPADAEIERLHARIETLEAALRQLVDHWRAKATRFTDEAQDLPSDDEERMFYEMEAARLYTCAMELAALAPEQDK